MEIPLIVTLFLYKCGSQSNSVGITWELVREAESQAPLQNTWTELVFFTAFPDDLEAINLFMYVFSEQAFSHSCPFCKFSILHMLIHTHAY